MPKAKPVSLFPLSFDEAMSALVKVSPQPSKQKNKKKHQRPKQKK